MKAKSKKQLSEKITIQKFLIGILTIAFVFSVLLVGGRGLLAVTDTKVEQKINEAVVLYALENPESELALVLAKYALVSEQSVFANLKEEVDGINNMLGVVTDQESQVRAERLCLRYSDSNFKYSCEFWGRLVIPTATTTVAEVNRLGRDAIVDYAEVEITDTVSSTWNAYVGVATSTFVAYDANDGGQHPYPNNLIDAFQYVTSTVPANAPDGLNNYRSISNSINDAGTLGVNTVPFASSSALVFFMQDDNGGNCNPSEAGGCGQTTSTNRGFSGNIKYHARYEVDL